jgi:hypothetical protein
VIASLCFHAGLSLREVKFEKGSRLKEIGAMAFSGSKLEKMEIPPRCEILADSSLMNVKSVTVSRENPFFRVEGEMLMSRDGKRVVQYLGSESSVLIKREIEVLGAGCFRSMEFVREVTFETRSGLKRMECGAFVGCGLEKITVPSSVEVVGEICFGMCRSLCEVTFEGSVGQIGRTAFKECKNLRIVRVPRGCPLDVNLPDECQIEYLEGQKP